MGDEQTKHPSRADDYRQQAKNFLTNFSQNENELVQRLLCSHSSTIALWSIAAELAEANERDREAEIRAKTSEAFVAGVQAELARQGVIIAGGMANVKPPRGR